MSDYPPGYPFQDSAPPIGLVQDDNAAAQRYKEKLRDAHERSVGGLQGAWAHVQQVYGPRTDMHAAAVLAAGLMVTYAINRATVEIETTLDMIVTAIDNK